MSDFLPLVFSFKRTLFGQGFVVEVRATNGRALCAIENDGVWMYGVNPGGMAARGDSPEAARDEFAHAFSRILKDIAAESPSFDVFKASVSSFFYETNDGFEPQWHEAVERVRIEHVAPPSGLNRVSADAPLSISIELKTIEDASAADNKTELEPALAA